MSVPTVVAAVRRIQPARVPHEDQVLGIAVLHPDEPSAAELETRDEWRERGKRAIAASVAHNKHIRDTIARLEARAR